MPPRKKKFSATGYATEPKRTPKRRRQRKTTNQRSRGREMFDNKLNDTRFQSNSVVERYCSAIEMGAFHEMASNHAGISPTTAKRWLTRGRKQREHAQRLEEERAEEEGREVQPVFPDDSMEHAFWRFLLRVEQAKSGMQIRMTHNIAKAARKGDWRAAARLLEAHDRGSWSKDGRVELNVTTIKPATDFGSVPVEQLETALLGADRQLAVSEPQVIDVEVIEGTEKVQ